MNAVTEKFKSIRWTNNAYEIAHWDEDKISLDVADLEIDGSSIDNVRLDLFLGSSRMALSVWPDKGDNWEDGEFSEIPKNHRFEDIYGKPAGANCTVSFGIKIDRGLGRWQFSVREIKISKNEQ